MWKLTIIYQDDTKAEMYSLLFEHFRHLAVVLQINWQIKAIIITFEPNLVLEDMENNEREENEL